MAEVKLPAFYLRDGVFHRTLGGKEAEPPAQPRPARRAL